MSDPDNVVPFPGVKQRRLHSDADVIRQKLVGSARLDHSAIPLLAQNLGRMAQRLDSENPLKGAKQMFMAAFPENWESVWRKRNRLVRLPGEAAPAFDASGQYEAAGAKYLHLADAFALLKSPGDQSARDSAVSVLTRGTTYNPRPVISGTEDELARVVGALRGVGQKLGRSGEVARAFSILRKHPIQMTASGPAINPEGQLGIENSRLVAKKIIDDEGMHWAYPYVEIGTVDFPVVVPLINLGPVPDFQEVIQPQTWAEAREWVEILLYPKAEFDSARTEAESIERDRDVLDRAKALHMMIALKERLKELGVGEAAFAFDETSPDPWAANEAALALPPHLQSTAFFRFSIGLCARPNENDQGFEILVTCGDDLFAYYPDVIFHIDDNESFVKVNHEVIYEGILARFFVHKNTVFAVPTFQMLWDIAPVEFVGGHELESDGAQQLLMHGAEPPERFNPSIWDDKSRLAPAPHLSVAGTVMRNLAFGKGLDRIDDLLLADAERRLKPVIAFYEQQMLAFQDSADF